MDHEFWLERWRKGEIGFHRDDVHPELPARWPALMVPEGARVFVPFCGKSKDMAWLAERGHPVIGAELSELAVWQFFSDRGLEPGIQEAGLHKVYAAGPYTIWCGDMFALPYDVSAEVAGAYDRASLVALPADMRPRYAAFMAERMPAGSRTLLVALDFDASEMKGPPFPVALPEIHDLFDRSFDVSVLHVNDALDGDPGLRKRGLSALTETCCVLVRK